MFGSTGRLRPDILNATVGRSRLDKAAPRSPAAAASRTPRVQRAFSRRASATCVTPWSFTCTPQNDKSRVARRSAPDRAASLPQQPRSFVADFWSLVLAMSVHPDLAFVSIHSGLSCRWRLLRGCFCSELLFSESNALRAGEALDKHCEVLVAPRRRGLCSSKSKSGDTIPRKWCFICTCICMCCSMSMCGQAYSCACP